MSNGSEALLVNPPPLFAGLETGVCVVEADVQPPKSSSAVTVGAWLGLLDDEIGDPHPPEMSLGVIFDGTLPRSTDGCEDTLGVTVGSGAPHPPPSPPEDHGSNSAALVDVVVVDIGAGAAAGFGAGVDKLNADLVFVLETGIVALTGGETCVGEGAIGGAGDGSANPENSSLANKSLELFGTAGFVLMKAEGCVKEKSRPFKAELTFGAS